MRLTYDMSAGALYIQLAGRAVARTKEIDDNTTVDLDAAGRVTGIEVVSIAHRWPLEEILRDYAVPEAEEAQLRAYFLLPATRTELAREALELALRAPELTIAATPPVPALT